MRRKTNLISLLVGVRAAAILARELQPLPDPVALIAHLSCANLILRRWFVHLYAGISTDDELKASCYRESIKKGRTIMFIEYDLCELAKERQSRLSGDNLMRELTTRYYGNLLPDAPMPFTHIFEPIDVIKDTLKNGGICPRAKVLQYLLPEKTEIAGIDPGVSGMMKV